jgi:serine/threonine protein kinase
MSPEQCLGEQVDARSDIYALGIMLFELVTSQNPFQPQSWPEAFRMHTQQPAPALESIRPHIPLELETVCEKCLAKDPRDRYQTAHQLAQDLQKVQVKFAQQGTSTPAASPENLTSVAEYLTQLDPLPAVKPKNVDQLVIRSKDQPPRVIMIDQDVLTIGRSLENDVVLKTVDIGISREHARLERRADGRYIIIDLESTNGVRLDNQSLTPKTAHIWSPGAAVYLGDYQLYIEPAGDSGDTGVHRRISPDSMPLPKAETGRLVVTLEPANVSVEPGKWAEVQIRLVNQGSRVDHPALAVEGIPAEWATLSHASLRLMPGETSLATLTLHPPRQPDSRAGRHTFRLMAHSMAYEQEDEILGNLHLAAYYNLGLDLHPSVLVNRDNTILKISNNGNSPEDYRIDVRDPQAALLADVSESLVRVDPGETVSVTLRFDWQDSPPESDSSPIPFEVKVSSPNSPTQVQSGTVRKLPAKASVSPIVPAPEPAPPAAPKPAPQPSSPPAVLDSPAKSQSAAQTSAVSKPLWTPAPTISDTEQRTGSLAKALNFSLSELDENRRGRVGRYQRILLREGEWRQFIWSMFVFGVGGLCLIAAGDFLRLASNYGRGSLSTYYTNNTLFFGAIGLVLTFGALRVLRSIFFGFPPEVESMTGRLSDEASGKLLINAMKLHVRSAEITHNSLPHDGRTYRAYYAIRPRYRRRIIIPTRIPILLSVEAL